MTRDFGDKLFVGAAQYYAKYRPEYPEELFKDILKIFQPDSQSRLFDLGCGTGELAIPLAKYFKSVLAVDPDDEMLREAKSKAKKQAITNIQWQKGSSKELDRIKGPFKLVTMGQSFHWMDQEVVLERLYDLVEASGGLAIIGKDPVEQVAVTNKKDEVVKKLIIKYLGPERLAGSKVYTHPPEKYESLLPKSKFHNFQERHYVVNLERNIDQILGHLYSTSWALRSHFGSQVEAFESELRGQLLDLSKGATFHEKTKFSLYTVTK